MTNTLPQPRIAPPVPPPPFVTRLKLKLKRIYRELGVPRLDREWADAWSLIDSVQGWMAPGQERWLFEAAYSLPHTANIVEIGSFKGRSTCSLGFGCRGTRKRVYAIDTFDGGGWNFDERDFLHEFEANVRRCGLSRYIEPIRGKSTEVAKGWEKPIDLIFIDGSHEYEAVKADFEDFFQHVIPGGIVAFHDVNEEWPGVLRFWRETASRQLAHVGNCSSLAYGRKPQ